MAEFTKFMSEKRIIDRWFVLKVALGGAFMGALLAVAFMIVSMGIWFTW